MCLKSILSINQPWASPGWYIHTDFRWNWHFDAVWQHWLWAVLQRSPEAGAWGRKSPPTLASRVSTETLHLKTDMFPNKATHSLSFLFLSSPHFELLTWPHRNLMTAQCASSPPASSATCPYMWEPSHGPHQAVTFTPPPCYLLPRP